MKVFELSPSEHNKSLDELVMFMAQVAHCYSEELANFAQELIDILQKHSTVLHPDMRMVNVQFIFFYNTICFIY